MMDTKKDKSVGLRMPQEMYDEIKTRAEGNYRTFNSMVVFLLKSSLEKPKTETMLERIYKKMLEIGKDGGL